MTCIFIEPNKMFLTFFTLLKNILFYKWTSILNLRNLEIRHVRFHFQHNLKPKPLRECKYCLCVRNTKWWQSTGGKGLLFYYYSWIKYRSEAVETFLNLLKLFFNNYKLLFLSYQTACTQLTQKSKISENVNTKHDKF